MVVLVDYDNLPRPLRNRGLDAIVRSILDSIGGKRLSSHQRIRIRLYGGWFSGRNLTRIAQDLATAIRGYPKAFTVVIEDDSEPSSISVLVVVDLAQSMEIDPKTVIENTYRQGGQVEGLQCMPPPYARCINKSACPLQSVHSFITNGNCPEPYCGLSTTDLLRKAGQKLVDTMMTADIIHIATNGTDDICITSSDDDLWPGIKSALLLNRRVIHLHTERKASAARYSQNAGPNYTELTLR